MSDPTGPEIEEDSVTIGRVLPLAAETEVEEPGDAAPGIEPLVREGDEPWRPYDVEDVVHPVRVVHAPGPYIIAYDSRTTTMQASSFGPVPEVPDGETARWGAWDDSAIRGLYVPITIICFGVFFTFYSVGIYSPNFHGGSAAAKYLLITVTLRVALLIAMAWATARIMEMSLGRIVPAVLKLSAIAISPGIAIGLVLLAAGMLGLSIDSGFTDYLSRPSFGSIAAAVISLITVFALFYALFDLPQDIGTWRFILLAWAIQFFVAGFFTHMIVDSACAGTAIYTAAKSPAFLLWQLDSSMIAMSQLFSPLRLREITFKNRIFVSPMCQYSSENGMPTDWHLVHLGSRAVGGAALVMVEATGVSPVGRISPWDSGIWSAEHGRAFGRIARFVSENGAVPGVQLAHAGRKASTDRPWLGGKPIDAARGGWQPIAPSPVPFDVGYSVPREMTHADIDQVIEQFVAAAKWSLEGGFEVVEIHMAHGYLLHEFLSPLSNRRADEYGGSLANRMRFPLRVATAIRQTWPAKWPVFVRISATDWAEGGWDLAQSVQFSRELKRAGIDLIDCSSGALVPHVKIPLGPGYQVPFSETIRRETGIATGAVGMITDAHQAEEIIAGGKADIVLLARQLLRDPYWPLHAAMELGDDIAWPNQYGRAKAR